MAARKAVKDASFEVILDFLNSSPDEGEHCKSNDVRSLFSLVRGSFHRLGAVLCYMEGDENNLRLQIRNKLIKGHKVDRVPHSCKAAITRSNWMLRRRPSTRGRTFIL